MGGLGGPVGSVVVDRGAVGLLDRSQPGRDPGFVGGDVLAFAAAMRAQRMTNVVSADEGMARSRTGHPSSSEQWNAASRSGRWVRECLSWRRAS